MSASVYFTGVTICKPEKCWGGYTLLPASALSTAIGARLIDMNGRVVHAWPGVYGSYDNKLLPGGHILGTSGPNPGHRHDMRDIVQHDWNNRRELCIDALDELEVEGETIRTARAHHDFQREGNPVGYYAPGQEPKLRGRTLINSTRTVSRPDLCSVPLGDTRLVEVDENGQEVWSWLLTDHWDELGLSEAAKNAFARFPGYVPSAGYAKEVYLNNCAWLGPNRWYDAGDARFHPDNIITDSRMLNNSFIIDKATGKIVWQIGPDYDTPAWRHLGTIIGQHHVHMIPQGLPGAGNILIFDNGGMAGYGNASPSSFDGSYNACRHYSRVLEINPATLDIVWSYNDCREFHMSALSRFFSAICSGMQRLPNGNTMICESTSGRVFEVTPEGETVWEYVDPAGFLFRAHRYPYDWVPLDRPVETAVLPPLNRRLHVENCAAAPDDDADFFTNRPLNMDPIVSALPPRGGFQNRS